MVVLTIIWFKVGSLAKNTTLQCLVSRAWPMLWPFLAQATHLVGKVAATTRPTISPIPGALGDDPNIVAYFVVTVFING